jgi:glycosyltransferase involved in cell wall biosynthesis
LEDIVLKLGLVLSQPFNHSLGTDARVLGLIEGLSKFEFEIHVFVPFGDEVHVPYNNVHVHRVFSFLPNLSSKKLFTRIGEANSNHSVERYFAYNEVILGGLINAYYRSLLKVVEELDLDIVHGIQVPACLACVRLKQATGIPTVAEIHGLWAEEMIASGAIKNGGYQHSLLRKLEKEACSNSGHIVVISAELKEHIKRLYGVPEERITVVPNRVFCRVETSSMVFAPRRVVFAGMLTYRENLELFVQSMPLVKKECPRAEFYVTRKGKLYDKVRDLAKSLDVSLEFFWFDESMSFFNFLGTCHVGVISSAEHVTRRISYPAKLFDYLAVGLPVVANDVGVWTNIIREHELGIVVDSNPQSFAGGILQLLNNPGLRYTCSQNALAFIRSRPDSVGQLIEVYRNLSAL